MIRMNFVIMSAEAANEVFNQEYIKILNTQNKLNIT